MEMDRISDLPDHLIQHILSFLPSTKQAVQTGILSKRWRKQWTQVPVLIFDSTGMSHKKFFSSIDRTLTLHESSKINTFHIHYDCYPRDKKNPNFDEIVRFATAKQVEDLSLSFLDDIYFGSWDIFSLPESLFSYTSLLKLRARRCSFAPIGKVDWACLKALNLVECKFSDRAIDYILSGTPSLEELELTTCDNKIVTIREPFHKLAIASQSLKKLALEDLSFYILEISCPNLEELSLKRLVTYDCKQIGEAIKNVLSDCLLLESLIVSYNYLCPPLPVIASQSLKRLVVSNYRAVAASFELSCPKLEELTLSGLIDIMNVNLRNLPSLLCATLAFVPPLPNCETRNSFKDILQQFQHIKELRVGKRMFELMTGFSVGDPPSSLRIKILILDFTIEHEPLSRIICLLQNFPVLETFVFTMSLSHCLSDLMADMDGFEENFCSSNHCLLSHLKRIKIYAIPRRDQKPTRVLNFIQFLLNNVRVLEKMTVVLPKPYPKQYSLEVSQKLFGLTRLSNHATVQLITE